MYILTVVSTACINWCFHPIRFCQPVRSVHCMVKHRQNRQSLCSTSTMYCCEYAQTKRYKATHTHNFVSVSFVCISIWMMELQNSASHLLEPIFLRQPMRLRGYSANQRYEIYRSFCTLQVLCFSCPRIFNFVPQIVCESIFGVFICYCKGS
jgi:hypothetical protein